MKATREEVRQFIEFAEFPLSIWCILPSADIGGIFVIFLQVLVSPNKVAKQARKHTSKYRKKEYMMR